MVEKDKENKRKIGTKYEKIAEQYLKEQGYVILELNYRCYAGEIDIIATDGVYLVFCEVKYRYRPNTALEAVDARKQIRISRSARCYLTEKHIKNKLCRFDVVGIEREHVIHIKNAFDARF